jgi:hypothetical protein
MIQQNYKIADTTAPLNFFKKQGYYTVGDKIYNSKVNALEAATRYNQPITWDFNDKIFENFNWRKPIDISLKELYRMRAQQLRDQYDYITVPYSGGADSDTVVRSFLDNGIHLDEIWHDRPFKIMGDKYTPSHDLSPGNLISEWDFTTKPLLEEIAKNHPRTKIVLADGTASLELEDFEDTCTFFLGHHYVILKRIRAYNDHVAEISKKYPRTAVIMPVDKPTYIIQNRAFCAFFNDNLCIWKSDYTNKYHRTVEYFFWTPDLPEIVAKQAQIMYQSMVADKRIEKLLLSPQSNVIHSREYRALTTKLFYQDYYNLNLFQADKSDSTIFSKHYKWATNMVDHAAIQSWQSSIQTRWNLIDPKFFARDSLTNELVGYQPIMHRRLYPIGML